MSQKKRTLSVAPPRNMCESLVEEAPIGVCLIQDGKVLFANRWLSEFSGYPLASEDSFDVLSLIHPDDRPLVAEELRRRLAGDGARSSFTVRFVKRGGAISEVELHATRVDHLGRPAIQGLLVDVTARLAAERNLQEYAVRLEESNRYRQLFGDIISHDLLNPVWVAENYLRLVMDGEIPEIKRPFLEGMRGALAKARGILVDARTYLRLQEGITPAVESIEIAQFVEEVAKSLCPLWEEKGQTVTLTFAPEARILGNPLFKEIVANLLSNAIKYAPQGSRIEVVVRDGPRIRLEVRDRGPGVPPEDRERIFQRFERLEKGVIKGVGLGLAIARRVAELHAGRVWVEENPGGGSVFVAEFPAAAGR